MGDEKEHVDNPLQLPHPSGDLEQGGHPSPPLPPAPYPSTCPPIPEKPMYHPAQVLAPPGAIKLMATVLVLVIASFLSFPVKLFVVHAKKAKLMVAEGKTGILGFIFSLISSALFQMGSELFRTFIVVPVLVATLRFEGVLAVAAEQGYTMLYWALINLPWPSKNSRLAAIGRHKMGAVTLACINDTESEENKLTSIAAEKLMWDLFSVGGERMSSSQDTTFALEHCMNVPVLGRTLIVHLGEQHMKSSIIVTMIAGGADPDFQDSDGDTALHRALLNVRYKSPLKELFKGRPRGGPNWLMMTEDTIDALAMFTNMNIVNKNNLTAYMCSMKHWQVSALAKGTCGRRNAFY